VTAASTRPSGADVDGANADAIRAAGARWLAAVASGDVDRVVGFYLDDAAFLVPNASPAFGSPAVHAVWTQLLAAPGLSLVWTPSSIDVAHAGDMAFEIGSYELTIGALYERHTDSGKYLVVWKRDEERWRVAADMFNSNLPPADHVAANDASTKR
jgi:uncharacterized protein (TIGR02246 family)